MNIRTTIILIFLVLLGTKAQADTDYKNDKTYLELRESMHHAFNDGDSARFFPALKNLEDYLLQQNDLHAYYTQRCNEIVFLMNRQKIYEAYIRARKLSSELREKKLEKEMYMAYNMLGHINRYCGNKETAKKNFYHVIELMEKYGYYESMPPIFMNIVNVEMDDDHDEAIKLLDKARSIAEKYSPDRVFDIETRRTVSYFNSGDIPKFLEGYKAYRKGVEEGLSSVHGRMMEIYYLAVTGKTDEAIRLAKKDLGDDGREAIRLVYEKAGRWKEAFESLREEQAAEDSINNVVLTNSMEGIRDQLALYDAEQETAHTRMMMLTSGIIMLALLVAALTYIVITRRRHLKELKKAYDHALESDNMKTAFIRNVSHEVRTPLNIISGFAQVIADPELTESVEERQHMAAMMQKSTHQITSLIDEMLGMSLSETSAEMSKDDVVNLNSTMRERLRAFQNIANKGTTMNYESNMADDFQITTNRNTLNSIVNALIENAVKNTEEGTIRLKASVLDNQLTIAVEDTGCGVPAAEAERIFERFVKLDSFKEGIGLGLPLARQLAGHMGGTVQLDTTYKGPGARFVVTLPL